MGPGDEIALRDGRRVLVRAIAPADAPRLQRLFDSLSARSRYQRFFQPMAELPPSLLARLIHIDPRRELALGAACGDEIVAVGRYAPAAAERGAEFALVVADAWQGQGLGRALLERLCDAAKVAGYAALYGTILNANREMLELAARLGFVPHGRSGNEITVVRRLEAP